MASTAYKRISVPIDENLFNAIQLLADATNGSIGSTASNWLKESEPQILALANAFQLAKTDPSAANRVLQKLTFEAQKYIAEEQLDMLKKG